MPILGDTPSLWVKLLERTEKRRRPVASPLGTDFSQLNIQESRRILRHTEHLERNWNSVSPIVYGTASLSHPKSWIPLKVIAVFPGASTLVLHASTPNAERLVLWSFGSKSATVPFCEMELLVDDTTTTESGRLCLACEIQMFGSEGHAREIRVYCIALRTDGTPEVNLVHQKRLGLSGAFSLSHLFTSQDVVGYIRASDPGGALIHLYNYTTEAAVVVSLDSTTSMGNEIKVTVSDDSLIITETCHTGSFRVYRCPSEFLPYGARVPRGDFAVQKLGQVDPSYISYNPNGPSPTINEKRFHWSPLGVHRLVSGNYVDPVSQQLQSSYTTMHFWPTDGDAGASDIYNNRRVARIELPIAHHLEAFSESGRYAVVYTQRGSSALHRELFLLQFHPGTAPRIDAKRIALPTSLPDGYVVSIAIDERLGLVFLYYQMGPGPEAITVFFHEP
ncbi:hypothetical protein DXG01_006720 [Tephrocybe rancida]|nr:hypothetical protein DXG01_006720 [Tephrocybe rancida]